MEPGKLNVKGKSDSDNLLVLIINILAHFSALSNPLSIQFRGEDVFFLTPLKRNILINGHYLEKHCFHLHNIKVES